MNLSVSDEIQAASDQLPGSVTPIRDFVTRTNSTYRIYWKDSRIGKIATGGGGIWASKSGKSPLAEAEHLDVTPADVP